MGLDTRAFRKATDEWRQDWVQQTNEAGKRPVLFGLMVEKLTEPVTLDEAPLYHQDDLHEGLPWPGGLVGGMLSGNGEGPSFRGKVYYGYVEAVTGRSLYAACSDYWQDDVLREVAQKLRAAVEDPPASFHDAYLDDEDESPPKTEREALAKWFEVCVEHDLVVGGDY